MSFENRICVITGAANGIGKCIAEMFLEKGALVAFIDIDCENSEKLTARFPCNTMFFHGDIANESVLCKFAGEVIHRFGKVDYLINNACLSRKGILSDCSYDNFNYVLRVGVTAPYMLSKLFLPVFSKKASIVNISSTRSFQSQSDTESYTAAKGGISALTHALSVSLSGRVRVNSISPGWIDIRLNHFQDDFSFSYDEQDKKQHPAGRIGKTQDIANMVMYLCSDKAGFITGENITIDGGMSRQMIYHNDHGWSFSG